MMNRILLISIILFKVFIVEGQDKKGNFKITKIDLNRLNSLR